MKAAIMQPYFLPYLGYWQLIAGVDLFVLYDDIQYTKRGWINRNRFLRNGEAAPFTIPLRGAPDGLDVRERWIADTFDRAKLLRQWAGAYHGAPFLTQAMDLLSPVVMYEASNLYEYLHHSVATVCASLGISTAIKRSSSIPGTSSLRAEARVIAVCREVGAQTYLNPIGGTDLYQAADFAAAGIALRFHSMRPVHYQQGSGPWVPNLSIVDLLMFLGTDGVRALLSQYDELSPEMARGLVASGQEGN